MLVFILNRKFIKSTVSVPEGIFTMPRRAWVPTNIGKIKRKRIMLRKRKYKRFRMMYTYYRMRRYKIKYRKKIIKVMFKRYLSKLVDKRSGKRKVIGSPSLLREQQLHSRVLLYVRLRNLLVQRGKKVQAENRVDLFLIYLKQYMPKISPFIVLERVISLLCPLFSVRTKKVAGQKLKVPVYLKVSRRYYLAFTWLLDAAEHRKDGLLFAEKLAKECRDVYRLRGLAFKKRLDICKEVDDSRVNLRFVK